MKISMEVGVIAPTRCHKMINGAKVFFVWTILGDWNRRFFSDKVSVPRPASQPVGLGAFGEPPGGRDVQRMDAALARRRRDAGADAVPGSPGRQYQKNQYNNRPAIRRSHTPWASGPANFFLEYCEPNGFLGKSPLENPNLGILNSPGHWPTACEIF